MLEKRHNTPAWGLIYVGFIADLVLGLFGHDLLAGHGLLKLTLDVMPCSSRCNHAYHAFLHVSLADKRHTQITGLTWRECKIILEFALFLAVLCWE